MQHPYDNLTLDMNGPSHGALIEDLVSANHILYAQNVVDGFGHISVRDENNPAHFLLSRSMAPALVHADDILEFDLDGNAVDARGCDVYVERFIHSEIYRSRPDVHAVVHSHSPGVIPFGATQVPLRPIYHMSAFLAPSVPVFEISDVAGVTDMLIRNRTLGYALASCLNDRPAALMRGHGCVVVGNSLPQVVYRAVYLEINARLQSEAMKLGDIRFLTDEEAALAAALNDKHLSRPWHLWKHAVREQK